MDSRINIRHAQPTEFEALCALIAELDRVHILGRPDVFRKPRGATREVAVIESLIAGPDSAILVADHASKGLAGLVILIKKSVADCVVRDARSFVEVDNLIIRPEMRHRGVARSLMAASRAWAESHGIFSLELSAWSFNTSAIAFYKAIGFQPAFERLSLSLGDGAPR